MHLYEILRRPITTEKSNIVRERLRQYTFEVDERANKLQVKEAVEKAFNVQVLDVNVMRTSRKRRHHGRRMVYKPAWKKAIVTIAADQRIELFEGV